ncbi:MAG: anaerobic ribonucleoside-triphosphate reductase [Candidatus Hydrogenedentota bacterium]
MTEPHWTEQQTHGQGMLDIQLSFPEPFVAVPRSLETIVKRDDRVEPFDASKIAEAIFHAARSIGGEDSTLAQSLASSVTLFLAKQTQGKALHVGHVDSAVERVLVEMGHERTALAYVQHRNKHLQLKQLHDGDARTVREALAEWRWSRRVSEMDISAEDCVAEQLDRCEIAEELRGELGLTIMTALDGLGLTKPSSELIRELTLSVLLDRQLIDQNDSPAQLHLGLADVERAFVGPFYDMEVLSTPDSSDRVLAASAKESYALNRLFTADIANAHTRGDLHIHDLGSIDRLHSIALHPDCIKRFGPLSNLARENFPPARRIEALIDDIATSTEILRRYCTDSIQWEAVNYSLAPYLVEFDEEALHEVSELLILSLMGQPEGAASCITKIDIAWDVPHYLQGIEAIGPNGSMTGKHYESYQNTAHDFAHSLLQVFREVTEKFDTLNLPLAVVTLPTSSDSDASTLAFTNKVALCALVLDDIEVRCDHDRPLLPFHDETLQPRSVIAQFATLNLARLGFSALGGADFWQELDRLFEIAALAFVEKKLFLMSLTERKSIGSYSHFSLQHDGKPFADLTSAEYGLVLCGFNECISALRGTEEFKDVEYGELASQLLGRLQAHCEEVLAQKGICVTLRSGESESISERLTRIDAAHFRETASSLPDAAKGHTYTYATTVDDIESQSAYSSFEQTLWSTLQHQDWIHGAVSLRRPDPDATFPEQLGQTFNRFFRQQPDISLHLHG